MTLAIKRILVPTDFSPCSSAALDHAAFLAERLDASLEVLHVLEPPQFMAPEVSMQLPGGPMQTLAQVARAQAGRDMERFLAPLRRRTMLPVRQRIELGDPCDVILRLAEGSRYDLIVIGTHGRTGLAHLLMGSIAEKVVRQSSCPVLTVRQSHTSELRAEGAPA
jgi:nucleotide-binding universal stress UspA family protein